MDFKRQKYQSGSIRKVKREKGFAWELIFNVGTYFVYRSPDNPLVTMFGTKVTRIKPQ